MLVLTPIYPWVANPQDAVFVRRQVRNLARAGLQCQVLAFRYCPPAVPARLWRLRYARHLTSCDDEAGFPVHDVFVSRHAVKDADVVPRVVEALEAHIARHPTLLETRVVYAHWLWPGGAAAIGLRRRFGWPTVAIARGSEMHHWQTTNRHCRSYVQRVIRESDRVLANCAGLRDECYRLVPDLEKRIDVAYNGCDPQRFTPAVNRDAVRRTLGLSPDANLMLCCGSVIERKGIRNLVRGWERFARVSPDWQLVVVGRLVERNLVELLTRTERVILVGPVDHDQVLAYMQAANAYVQPSIHEGLANATMEAMATALPAIATNTGGQGELIADGENGLLVPVEDDAALSRAFATIATDPRRAREMGALARDTIVRRFSQDRQVAALAALLEETTSERHRERDAVLDCDRAPTKAAVPAPL
ncbi:MAG TPA: glycosyltransferase [Steroidobacteraceae bacterium]